MCRTGREPEYRVRDIINLASISLCLPPVPESQVPVCVPQWSPLQAHPAGLLPESRPCSRTAAMTRLSCASLSQKPPRTESPNFSIAFAASHCPSASAAPYASPASFTSYAVAASLLSWSKFFSPHPAHMTSAIATPIVMCSVLTNGGFGAFRRNMREEAGGERVGWTFADAHAA